MSWMVLLATILHCKAILGQGQPGLLRWILVWIMPQVQDWLVEQLICSPMRYHCATAALISLWSNHSMHKDRILNCLYVFHFNIFQKIHNIQKDDERYPVSTIQNLIIMISKLSCWLPFLFSFFLYGFYCQLNIMTTFWYYLKYWRRKRQNIVYAAVCRKYCLIKVSTIYYTQYSCSIVAIVQHHSCFPMRHSLLHCVFFPKNNSCLLDQSNSLHEFRDILYTIARNTEHSLSLT